MFKYTIFFIFGLFISTSLQASITITPADIQQDAEGYYYLYELTYDDLIRGSTKFEDDASNISNITVHKTPVAIPPATPDPRWVCATTGEKTACFNYVFDFSEISLNGYDVIITSVEIWDQLSAGNNKGLSEDSTITSKWIVVGTYWHTLNSISSPQSMIPQTSVQSHTLNFSNTEGIHSFSYRVEFECFDKDGFDENLNQWNYLNNSSIVRTDHFYVKIYLAYDILSGGAGTELNPFLISTPEDLIYLGEHSDLYDRHFLMTNDIDMAGYGPFSEPVIASTLVSGTVPFTGHFDGNGYSIQNIVIDDNALFLPTSLLGLFGKTGEPACIQNIKLSNLSLRGGGGNIFWDFGGLIALCENTIVHNCSVTGLIQVPNENIGGLIGRAIGSSITDCQTNIIIKGGYRLGGLVGKSEGGSIHNCHTDVTLSGSLEVGGLVGTSIDSDISDCTVKGRIRGNDQISGNEMGGLIGSLSDNSNIDNCHTEVYISGKDYIGGLVGNNCSGSHINHCWSSANVFGQRYTGGLVGNNVDSIINNSYSIATADCMYFTGGLVGYSQGNSNIENCFARGTIGGRNGVGGLAGVNLSNISNCYSESTIITHDNCGDIGGFIGYNKGDIFNCYAICYNIIKYTGSGCSTSVGSFIGEDNSLVSGEDSASYTACFWDTEVSGMTDGVGESNNDNSTYPDLDPAGITGLPTANLKVQGLYISQGWDFINETTNGTDDVWAIIENVTYPRFASECIDPPAGDVNGDCKLDLLDFAELSEDWLKCGLMDEDLCL